MRDMEEALQQFIVFGLEKYKVKKNISGALALHEFEVYDVFSYLTEGFEVLHTQSRDYIVADIEEYINRKKRIA